MMQIMLDATHGGGGKHETATGMPRLEELFWGRGNKPKRPLLTPQTMVACVPGMEDAVRERLVQTKLRSIVSAADVVEWSLEDMTSGRVPRFIDALRELLVPGMEPPDAALARAQEAQVHPAVLDGSIARAIAEGTFTGRLPASAPRVKGVPARGTTTTAGTPFHLRPDTHVLVLRLDRDACAVNGITPVMVAKAVHRYRADVFFDAANAAAVGSDRATRRARGRPTVKGHWAEYGPGVDAEKAFASVARGEPGAKPPVNLRAERHACMRNCAMCVKDVRDVHRLPLPPKERVLKDVTYQACAWHHAATVTHSPPLCNAWFVVIRPWSRCGTHHGPAFLDKVRNELLTKLCIGGVAGVTAAKIVMEKAHVPKPSCTVGGNSGGPVELVQVERPRILASGSCLAAVARIPGVDWFQCTSNNVMEVQQTLGVWAARAVLIQELRKVMLSGGNYIDNRHVLMLADTVFRDGKFRTVARSGIATGPTGPLHRMTFELQYKVIVNSTVIGDTDTLDGPTQAVLLGQRALTGTGAVGIVQPKYVHGQIQPLHSAVANDHLVLQENVAHARRAKRLRERVAGPAPPRNQDAATVGPVPVGAPEYVPCAPSKEYREYMSNARVTCTLDTPPVHGEEESKGHAPPPGAALPAPAPIPSPHALRNMVPALGKADVGPVLQPPGTPVTAPLRVLQEGAPMEAVPTDIDLAMVSEDQGDAHSIVVEDTEMEPVHRFMPATPTKR